MEWSERVCVCVNKPVTSFSILGEKKKENGSRAPSVD